MAKETYPTITDNGVQREMTKIEFEQNYSVVLESSAVVDSKLEQIRNKEIAIAKFVALGITEADLKALGE